MLESFDATSVSLKLLCGTLPITDQDVHDTLGLHVGKRSFNYASTSKRKNMWTSQFPKKPQYNILPSTLVDIISTTDEADEMFKLNFLMVMSNVLI